MSVRRELECVLIGVLWCCAVGTDRNRVAVRISCWCVVVCCGVVWRVLIETQLQGTLNIEQIVFVCAVLCLPNCRKEYLEMSHTN